jgi:prepilin-type N-terminal cleavage/methylation domain-containing protein
MSAIGSAVRRGFTLWEMVVVLALLAVTLGVAVPAYVRFGAASAAPSDASVAMLRAARETAVRTQTTVTLVLDPATGVFRVDTTGASGTATLAVDTLAIDARATFDADSARLRWTFRPTGAALADTVRLRADGAERALVVDAWNGEARVEAR